MSLMNNKTFSAYLNDRYNIDDDKYPKERMMFINNETSFNNTFKKFENIDFKDEMIAIHTFTTASNSKYKLKNIKLNEKNNN